MATRTSRKITFEAVEVTEHPLLLRPEEESRTWADCPLDILLIVFESLEPADLMSCLKVNSYWRDAVNYMGVHSGIWMQLAQAGMVNKGIDLRRRGNPRLSWKDLYINYQLWHYLKQARLSWTFEVAHKDIRHLHIYKDILIMESDEDYFKKYFHIGEQLVDVTKKLVDAAQAHLDRAEETLDGNGNSIENLDGENHDAHGEKECSYMSDKMLKKLVQDAPFTRLLVLNEECYYMLNQQNILHCSKWDEENQKWLAFVLARYYMCNKQISDISVYNDDVYMLLKTGLVFKLDRTGRNFRPDCRFNAYITPAQYEVSRMIYGLMDSSIQRAGTLRIPNYGTGTKVMFHTVSVVVSVPSDLEFKINEDDKTGHIVIEYPGLTCATQHGEVLFLGFMDGKIGICISQKLVENGGKCEITACVQDCPGFPTQPDEDPSIVAIEVYEDLNTHKLFVATRSAVYRLTVTHPRTTNELLGLDKYL